jgi:hypothetical protein
MLPGEVSWSVKTVTATVALLTARDVQRCRFAAVGQSRTFVCARIGPQNAEKFMVALFGCGPPGCVERLQGGSGWGARTRRPHVQHFD